MQTFKKTLILGHYTVNDPTTVNTVKSFAAISQEVVVLQQSTNTNESLRSYTNVRIISVYNFRHLLWMKGMVSLLRAWWYRMCLKWYIFKHKPDVVASFMLYPLAALAPRSNKTYQLICCIYDIPSVVHAGSYDKRINKKGWHYLKQADVVWASDEHKAALTQQYGQLKQLPLVCHNAPALDAFDYKPGHRSKWLREKLHAAGALSDANKGMIMLRAGAIGDWGGIEETLDAMTRLPEDLVFLMMGRPDYAYKEKLLLRIQELGLTKRALLWDRPDDDSWKKAIEGADIGHLLHLEPVNNAYLEEIYRYNSSLSNYRLFNYMAVGLPILSYDDSRLDHIHQQLGCFSVVNRKGAIASIQTLVEKLCNDHAFYEQQSVASFNGFAHYYNWPQQFAPVLHKLNEPCHIEP